MPAMISTYHLVRLFYRIMFMTIRKNRRNWNDMNRIDKHSFKSCKYVGEAI